jgi:hypothetical protein
VADQGIVVEGADQLVRTLHEFAADLDDLSPANQKAAQLLLDKAGPRTPRASGALAASGHVEVDASGAAVVYDEVYAGVIHNGWPDHNISPQPWLADTAVDEQPDLVEVYVDHIEDLAHQVHGI